MDARWGRNGVAT